MSKYIFIDESLLPNSRIIFGIVVIDGYLIDDYRKAINNLREDLLHNPINSQSYNIEGLEKSFHYSKDHRSIKNFFIEVISSLSFESLIFIESENGNKNFKDIVEKRCLYIYDFLTKRYKTTDIKFIYEKTDALRGFQMDTKIKFQQKDKIEEPLLSITDYIIGIFRKLYESKRELEAKKIEEIRQEYKTDYYRVENKIRFIKDSEIVKPFTRRNLFLVDNS